MIIGEGGDSRGDRGRLVIGGDGDGAGDGSSVASGKSGRLVIGDWVIGDWWKR